MTDPSLPIPNDDPLCHCALEPEGVPEGAAVIKGGLRGQPQARVALHADCPHHGGIVRAMRRSTLGAFSIGRPPPSADKVLAWAKAAEWKFTSYYKYRFTFTGRTPSLAAFSAGNEPLITATATVGGDANDIYKFEVEAGKPMTWDEIACRAEPYLTVTDLDGKVIYEG